MKQPTTAQLAAVKEFRRQRDKILRTLDVKEFLQFLHENNPRLDTRPVDPSVPLASMHKARLRIVEFSEEEKRVSREWLQANGYSSGLRELRGL